MYVTCREQWGIMKLRTSVRGELGQTTLFSCGAHPGFCLRCAGKYLWLFDESENKVEGRNLLLVHQRQQTELGVGQKSDGGDHANCKYCMWIWRIEYESGAVHNFRQLRLLSPVRNLVQQILCPFWRLFYNVGVNFFYRISFHNLVENKRDFL